MYLQARSAALTIATSPDLINPHCKPHYEQVSQREELNAVLLSVPLETSNVTVTIRVLQFLIICQGFTS